jgi:adenosylcobinamide kinase / adenosylcobinamide-phosphate guanylyltransferase
MKRIVFILGGCRSGKSRHALMLAEGYTDRKKIFVATATPGDEEMTARIAKHRADRGPDWTTVETPVRLPECILEVGHEENVVLVDCLTLWLNNLLMEKGSADRIPQETARLVAALQGSAGSVIVVSNEVGAGIVPENPLTRRFRDEMGAINRAVAECADTVLLMVAGIPVTVKKALPRRKEA